MATPPREIFCMSSALISDDDDDDDEAQEELLVATVDVEAEKAFVNVAR
jgi:hypothetical protein